jgi:poly-gamma-glutamate capsule biosynthesis protein CapA/YwtB (metallophosphatase superfamily)
VNDRPARSALLLPLLVGLFVLAGIAVGLADVDRPDTRPLDSFPPLAEGEGAILFGGDTLLAGGSAIRGHFERDGADWMFRELSGLIESAQADAFVVNLEGPITTKTRKGKPNGRKWTYQMRPPLAPALVVAGITHASLANNHALDRRLSGLYDSIDAVREQGIVPFGAGRTLAEAAVPMSVEVGGARVAILGGMEPFKQYRDADWGATDEEGGILMLSSADLADVVGAARRDADLVVAFPHWGKNYKDVRGSQRRLADRLVEAGVDAVVGHHGHAAQAFTYVDGTPVLWGLGNLFFGTPGRFGHDKWQPGYGQLARMVLRDGAIQRIEIVPIRINNRLQDYQPRPCTRSEARRVLEFWSEQESTRIRFSGGVGVLDVPGLADVAPEPHGNEGDRHH